MLVAIAAYRLRVAGRLVFLLPVPACAECPPLVRGESCLRLVAVRRNLVSLKMDRLCVILEKTKEAVPADYQVGDGAGGGAEGLGVGAAVCGAPADVVVDSAESFAASWTGRGAGDYCR